MALPAHQHAPSFAAPHTGARTLLTLLVLGVSTLLFGACNSGAAGSVDHKSKGFSEGPGGKLYFDETHQGGDAGFLKIVEMFWGRLVDVHDLDQRPDPANPGQLILVPSTLPVFRDFVISENIKTDGSVAGLTPGNPISGQYVLETNPVTQKTRLIVLREFNALADQPLPPGSVEGFIKLVEKATTGLSPIQPKSDDPSTLPPFSFIARNAALVLRMNDLMKDDASAQMSLAQDVKLLTSYPPIVFFEEKRIFFDPNYGGFEGSSYHASRIIVDMTVTQAEAADMSFPVGVNTLGLPPSLVTTSQANVAIRIPSKIAPSVTQFTILKNLKGHGVATSDHGPVDFGSATIDVVRAMRSGNEVDENNGFLLDLNAPQLLGGWPVTVDDSTPDPLGEPGFEFLIDVTFTTPCQAAPKTGNIIELPGTFIEVTQNGVLLGGFVDDLRVRVLTDDPVAPADLLGSGTFKRTYDPGLAGVQDGCWLGFAPLPGTFPAAKIKPGSQMILRFSEPMDPASVTPFDTFMIGRVNLALDDLEPPDIVVGEVNPSADLKEFSFTPVLPLKHANGTAESYYVNLDGTSDRGISDLAGNAPVDLPVQLEFTIDPTSASESNDGVVMRFSKVDEVKHPGAADGFADVRGQFFYDLLRGVITSRPVVRSVATADRNQPVVSIMIPFGPGVQTPLSPLGSKLMHVWRYADVGFSVTEENNFNLDVEGLYWSPIGSQVVSDFFEEYMIKISHSHYLPDEHIDPGSLLPTKPLSGLKTTSYVFNTLLKDGTDQEIGHAKGLGYVVNPLNLFTVGPPSSPTFLMPFPLNRGITNPADKFYWTWRDTSILEVAAPNGNGVPLAIEVDVGLATMAGSVASVNQVPTIGLPILMEHSCYPTESGVGLNAFDISLALNTSRLPAFRVFSTGGTNSSLQVITKDPDLELVPDGGFNPMSVPPGAVTPPDDPSFYIGQMDTISRISRMHTIWIQTLKSGPQTVDFLTPVIEPTATQQPVGTQLVFAYRGASSMGSTAATNAFDSDLIDPYGDVRLNAGDYIGDNTGVNFFPPGVGEVWAASIDDIDGASYFQVRISFVGDPTSLLNAELSAIGVPFEIL